ncbi:MAG: UDP-glucose/GDP-mannose dehydrogenase family protein [Candidatus Sumerlaeia bacterium]|nr:UDP-glucose/GDP-mannose dehydrogenase family protein [Candidatus Sumerlaeia bacterium]
MNVCVIGVGYVGLVTGTVFADLGNEVICVDIDENKINMLKRNEMPIYEPGLEELVTRNVKEGRLSFTTDIGEGVRRSEVIFIAVGTPPRDNGETDLSQVEAVAIEIAKHIDSYKIIVNKSTVPVGTGDLVRRIIAQNKTRDIEFDVVSNPEFLREGSAIADSLEPDRIVIGAPNQEVALTLLELYAPIERPMLITDVASAEMIKYASNAFLATKISFINMIADLCEKTGADIALVAKGMGYDHRIGMHFLQAGLGYGGSCFPKDTLSLIHTARKYGEEFTLLEEVVRINQQRVPRFAHRICQRLNPIKDKVIAILGLAFKPNTDDLRDAKSLELIKILKEKGVVIKAYDPVAMPNAKKIIPDIIYCKNAYDAAEGADAAVIVTDWNEFKLLNLERLKSVLKQPIIFDGRNIYNPKRLHKMGFEYYSIGRK